MNTFWSLTASTVITFWLSFILKKGKFSIDHILNATLSGGIAIAACAEFFTNPYPAMIIGVVSGVVSTI